MKKVSDFLYRISTGWVTLAALILFTLFTALILPGQASKADASSGGNAGSPDMSFFYSRADLYEMAEAYGEVGRAAYIQARFSFDVIWPLVYTYFLATALSWIFRRANVSDSAWCWTNLTPIVGMIFDFLENFSTSLVMFRYPNLTLGVDALAPWFTAFKWIFVNGSFLLLFVGGMVEFWKWIAKK